MSQTSSRQLYFHGSNQMGYTRGWPCRSSSGSAFHSVNRVSSQRIAELLPVPYFHVVFTLPGPIANIAYQNQAVVYDLLLKTAAETLITIAADPKHLGARIGLTAVLHSWGSALTQNPHS